MEKHSVSRLIGAPPGYVGYEEGGTLTEAIRRKPYQIILLDEMEKAHRDVSNILLQVFDEGRLTDSQGRTVDFRNTILIMTSNLGSDLISSSEDDDSKMQDMVMDRVRGYFAPELLNRIDEISIFNRLKRENMDEIVKIELKKVQDRLKEDRNITLNVDNNAFDLIADLSYDPIYGARPLKRTLQRKVLSPLAMKILAGDVSDGDVIKLSTSSDDAKLLIIS